MCALTDRGVSTRDLGTLARWPERDLIRPPFILPNNRSVGSGLGFAAWLGHVISDGLQVHWLDAFMWSNQSVQHLRRRCPRGR